MVLITTDVPSVCVVTTVYGVNPMRKGKDVTGFKQSMTVSVRITDDSVSKTATLMGYSRYILMSVL